MSNLHFLHIAFFNQFTFLKFGLLHFLQQLNHHCNESLTHYLAKKFC